MMPQQSQSIYAIDPERLAFNATNAVAKHAARLACVVNAGFIEPSSDAISPLHEEVRTLARCTICGEPPPKTVDEHERSLAIIWMCAADGVGYKPPVPDDPDLVVFSDGNWPGLLMLVIRAARARENLENGHPVGPADLAVLAGMSARNIRALLRSGDIAGEDDGTRWSIQATEAAHWLSRRTTKCKICKANVPSEAASTGTLETQLGENRFAISKFVPFCPACAASGPPYFVDRRAHPKENR